MKRLMDEIQRGVGSYWNKYYFQPAAAGTYCVKAQNLTAHQNNVSAQNAADNQNQTKVSEVLGMASSKRDDFVIPALHSSEAAVA